MAPVTRRATRDQTTQSQAAAAAHRIQMVVSGTTNRFETRYPKEHPLSSADLIKTHWTLHRIIAITGAAEPLFSPENASLDRSLFVPNAFKLPYTRLLYAYSQRTNVIFFGAALKISDKIRPIVSGAKDLYETAIHHADYTTAYTAQMEIFNIAAKDIIIQEWNEKDKLNWPILETEIKKHTFLSSLEPSDSHASSSKKP